MASDDEEDYMSMTFGEEPQMTETSLQRRQRLKREGEIKGRVKSKAEQAAQEREERDAALAKSMLEGEEAKKSKGLAMMAKMGFVKGGGLGSKDSHHVDADAKRAAAEAAERLVEPLRLEIKEDRGGIGLDSERKRKLNDAIVGVEKKQKVEENEFRDRVRREREQARQERQVYAAMKVCERLDEEKPGMDDDKDHFKSGDGETKDDNNCNSTSEDDKHKKKSINTRSQKRPLKSIPIVWRGLVRRRKEAERERRMRYDLEQSAATTMSHLPTYADDLDDNDDKKAMGKTVASDSAAGEYHTTLNEDLDEDDEELAEFDALDSDKQLGMLVGYLRAKHKYCFWCKFGYPDESMDGCPGLTEEDHD